MLGPRKDNGTIRRFTRPGLCYRLTCFCYRFTRSVNHGSERRPDMRSQTSVLGVVRRVLKLLLYLAVFLLVPLLVGFVNLGGKWTSEGQSADVQAYSAPLHA